MIVRVRTAREGERPRPVLGPGDLSALGAGDLIDVMGEPGARDGALWGPPLGLAVMRGASVRRLP